MFPEETHVKIVQQIDAIEAELFGMYRKLERLRVSLQNQWRVLPDGANWTEEKSEATRYSEGASR